MNKPMTALLAGLAMLTAMTGVSSQSLPPYAPGLVDLMMTVQSHHAKLWLAGSSRNWDLAEYQADELKELLEDVAKRVPEYKGTPVAKLIETAALPAVAGVERTISNRDSTTFATAFDRLTAACNSCHEAANRGFIVIQRPANSQFPNQSFVPRKR